MVDPVRRDVLIGAGSLGLALAIGSYAAARPAATNAAYQFFTPAEASFIETAIDRLIPADGEWPGAHGAGVAQYIDQQLAGPYGAGERLYLAGPITPGLPGQGYQLGLTPAELYRQALRGIAAELERRKIDFTRASDEDKDSVLRQLERSELRIGEFSSAVFFETLLANTIEGFFADPVYGGNRHMAGWKMIGFPGAYAAYLGVYTHHGIAFDREPLSIAEMHHHDGHAQDADAQPRNAQGKR